MDISKQISQNQSNNAKTHQNLTHKVELDHLHSMSVSGVVDVPTFTDKLVEVVLANEKMTVSGIGMSIKNLDIENGRLSISGQVNCIKYSSNNLPQSFVKRIFK